jgi:hypothetical protein
MHELSKRRNEATVPMHVYEVRPRKDHRGVDLISDAMPFGRLWYGELETVSNAIGYAKGRSRSHDAVIRVCDDAGNVIETWEHDQSSTALGKPPYEYAGPARTRYVTCLLTPSRPSHPFCGHS